MNGAQAPSVGIARRDDIFCLVLLALLCLTKGMVWMSVFPIFKITDEPAHFDHVQYRAENHLRRPLPNGEAVDSVMSPTSSEEVRLAWEATNRYWRERFLKRTSVVPEERKLGVLARDRRARLTHGQMPAMHYPGFFYSLGALAYHPLRGESVLDRVAAVRFVSVLFGLVAVLATYLAGRLAFRSAALALTAAALVALQPMESQQTTGINNDAALIGVTALLFLVQLRIWVRGATTVSWVDGVLLGGLTALAIETKPQALALLPVVLFLVGWTLRTSAAKLRARLFAGFASASFAIGLVVSRFPLPARASQATNASSFPAFSWSSLLEFPAWLEQAGASFVEGLYRGFWGRFCWLDVSLSQAWFTRLHLVGSLVAAGAVAAIATRVLTPSSRTLWWSQRAIYFSAGVCAIGVTFVLFLEYFARVALNLPNAIQGRAFLFVLPALALCVVSAIGSLLPERLRILGMSFLVTGAAALHIAALITVIRYQYVG